MNLIDQKTQTIISELRKFISPVYLVGGSVRDILVGKTPKDYDFCTPLTPDEVEIAIKNSGKRCYNIGKRFGTLGVKIEGEVVEITTFRGETYTIGRKPDVEFVKNLSSDLSRRDFTINAIALSENGKLIDQFNGINDIENKVIKSVGNPSLRVKEDPLRMLRCARFASQLGFTVDASLISSMSKNAHRILEVSKERWMIELDKILVSKNPSRGLDILMETGLMNFIIPELSLQKGYDQNSNHHDFPLWEHTLKVVENTPNLLVLRWSALLHDIAKPFVMTKNKSGRSNYVHHEVLGSEIVEKTARYLRWSNELREAVRSIVLTHLQQYSELKIYDDMSKRG